MSDLVRCDGCGAIVADAGAPPPGWYYISRADGEFIESADACSRRCAVDVVRKLEREAEKVEP